MMQPTCRLRFVKRKVAAGSFEAPMTHETFREVRILQQLWEDLESGDEAWRNVEEVPNDPA